MEYNREKIFIEIDLFFKSEWVNFYIYMSCKLLKDIFKSVAKIHSYVKKSGHK